MSHIFRSDINTSETNNENIYHAQEVDVEENESKRSSGIEPTVEDILIPLWLEIMIDIYYHINYKILFCNV
jgi:hypothetical protein